MIKPAIAGQAAPGKFEAAAVGGEVIRRRRGAAVLRALPPAEAYAAEAYARAAEIVLAGGASISSASAMPGGAPSREGRQFHAVRFVEFIRRMDRAIGQDALRFRPRGRDPVVIPILDAWRAVVVWGRPLSSILEARHLKRVPAREKALAAALLAAASRASAEIGKGADPTAHCD